MNETAQTWVLEALGAREAHDIRSLAFGITSDLRLIDVDGRFLVMRRYETDDVIDDFPGVVQNEAHALGAARLVLGDLVPQPVAFDVSGARAGRPSLLMTFLPGSPLMRDLDMEQIARPLAELHASRLPGELPRYHPWFDAELVGVPTRTRQPDAWSQLVDLVRSTQPAAPDVFLHRDFHQGNLLWHDGRLSGVVDWPSSCRGPRGVDVAHTRGNLALVEGVPAADRFLHTYGELVPGYAHHPWWDAADLFSFDDDFRGVIAFNAFGAELDVELLWSRADAWAVELARAI